MSLKWELTVPWEQEKSDWSHHSVGIVVLGVFAILHFVWLFCEKNLIDCLIRLPVKISRVLCVVFVLWFCCIYLKWSRSWRHDGINLSSLIHWFQYLNTRIPLRLLTQSPELIVMWLPTLQFSSYRVLNWPDRHCQNSFDSTRAACRCREQFFQSH